MSLQMLGMTLIMYWLGFISGTQYDSDIGFYQLSLIIPICGLILMVSGQIIESKEQIKDD